MESIFELRMFVNKIKNVLCVHTTFEINNYTTMTRIPTVTLTYNTSRPMADVRFSNDALFLSNSGWISATTPGMLTDWVMATDGDLRLLRAVYAQFRDEDGAVYGPVDATILYDPDAPTTPSISLLGALPPAMLRPQQAHLPLTVTLQIGSGDTNSGVDVLVLSDNAAFTDAVTHTLHGASMLIDWHVPATYFAVPRLYVKAYDRAGNMSEYDRALVYQVFLIQVMKP